MEEQYTIRGINGTSTMSRAAYEDYQQSLALRRADGRFTLEEAAMMLTEETKERATTMLEKLMQAARDGTLPVYEPGKYAQHQPQTVREFYEETYWEDLNAWLDAHEQRITWRFPMPDALRDEREINAAFRETVYNGKTINWRYWVHQMPMLTAAQASRLMLALDPDIFESLDNRPNKNDPSQVCDKAKKIQRLAETQGKQSANPAEWLDWAKSQGFSVHAGFTLAVGELPNAAQLEQTDRNTKTGTNVKKWDDAKLRALWEESILPGVTNVSLGKKYGISGSRIGALIKKAREQFGAGKTSAYSQLVTPSRTIKGKKY